jgi:UDP-glucose 4-epimerase
VFEVIRAAERVTKRTIPHRVAARRAGDPAVLVAGAGRVASELGWSPQHSSLEEILESAWAWHRAHPNGYERPE